MFEAFLIMKYLSIVFFSALKFVYAIPVPGISPFPF